MIENIKESVSSRLKAPILGTLFISYIFFNSEMFLQFYYSKTYEQFSTGIKDYQLSMWKPVLASIAYFFIQRIVMIIVDFFNELFKLASYKAKSKASEQIQIDLKNEYLNLQQATIKFDMAFDVVEKQMTAFQRTIKANISNNNFDERTHNNLLEQINALENVVTNHHKEFGSLAEKGFYEFQ